MKLLNDLISESLLKAIGWTLVHSLWQLILIAAILWLVLKLVHRAKPSLKYGLAVGALGLSLAASIGTFIYQYGPEESSRPFLTERDLQVFLSNPSIIQAEAGIESTITQATFWIEQNLPLLVNFWFLGALLFLFRLVNSLSEIRSLRKSSSPVTDFQLEKMVYRMAGKMGINADVQLRISSSGVSPLTFGTLKPIILLPAGLLFQLSPLQLEAIIAHELAHVKRNDYLINLLLSCLEVLFFYHPCYWWMNNTIKELRENAADDLVMKVGVEPKILATSLAEVLNFAKQNPPELALAAGKRRNPTLQRIKRLLGYPSQNYPQNPIISIPMLLTLLLSAGLMASAQQDTPKPLAQVAPVSNAAPVSKAAPLAAAFPVAPTAPDTTIRKGSKAPEGNPGFHYGKNIMVFSDGGYSYRISGDTLISDKDTIIMSGKTKMAFDQLKQFDWSEMPALDLDVTPMVPMEFEMAPIPDFNFDVPMDIEVFAMEPMVPMEPLDFVFEMTPPMPPMVFFSDTTKMTPEQRKKMEEEFAMKQQEWEKNAEENAEKWKLHTKEMEKRAAEWAATWEPKMKEFEGKMKEWEAANKPKMEEFEQKMKEWQAAQEPKMKEFELKMKEWEATQKPKMEEFQKKMEIWQKEHQAKLQEFQKLVQEELKKDDNK
ncbi:MAG TPA: M56 family metallopeptidase [Algoriphagus sp.]|nr:M56 family metallopeptidase [Algoriphagus sp.]